MIKCKSVMFSVPVEVVQRDPQRMHSESAWYDEKTNALVFRTKECDVVVTPTPGTVIRLADRIGELPIIPELKPTYVEAQHMASVPVRASVDPPPAKPAPVDYSKRPRR